MARPVIPLQSLQIRSHVGCVLVAQVAIFLQRLVDDVFQLRRHIGIQPDHGHRGAVHDGLTDHRRTFSVKRQITRRHLIEHRTE